MVDSVENTVTGMDKNGYTMVCSFTTAGGVQLTAVLADLPYSSGKGAEQCLPQMAALMNTAAKTADAAAGTAVIEAGKALSAEQTAGVAAVLPAGRMLTAARSVRLVSGGNGLQNSSEVLFGSSYSVKPVYYDGLQTALENYVPGTTTEVGYLTVCSGTGSAVMEKIPLLLK